MTKIDLKTLNEYEKDGWIKSQKHPHLPLLIWNYTPQTQYSKYWTEVTLQCRGLVTNLDGDIVARPFKKFFNYEELNPEDIPKEDYVIYEKMDRMTSSFSCYSYEWGNKSCGRCVCSGEYFLYSKQGRKISTCFV